MARHDFSVLYVVQNPQSKDLQGDSKSCIPAPEFLFKVGVGQSLCGTSMSLSILKNVRPAYHCKKLMHSAVGRSIRLFRKTHFPDRPELTDERWNRVRSAFPVGNQIEHRVFRRPLQIGRILRIRYQEAARTAHRGLVVANAALVPVEPNS